MTSDVLTAAAQQWVRIRIFWWGGRRGWRKKWWRVKDPSCLCRSDHWSQVWVTAADFPSASLRCWSQDLRHVVISSSYAQRWFKMARISLAGEGILWINLFIPWRTAHLPLIWSMFEIIGVRFSPFPLGKSWRLVPYDHSWVTCWAWISTPSLIIWWFGGENMQIFTHLA